MDSNDSTSRAVMRRRWLRSLARLLALGAATAQVVHAASSFTLGSATAGPGEDAQIAVQFQADGNPVAVQFDVQFDPTRLTPGYAVAGQTAVGHVVRSASPAPGVVRVVIYSASNRPLANGALVSLPLRVLASAPGGSTPVSISNGLVSNGAATRLEPVTTAGGSVTIRNEVSPMFQRPTLAANGQLVLTLNGQDGRAYTLQASGDLDSWQSLTTVVASGGVAVFTEAPAAGGVPRFYRAVLVP